MNLTLENGVHSIEITLLNVVRKVMGIVDEGVNGEMEKQTKIDEKITNGHTHTQSTIIEMPNGFTCEPNFPRPSNLRWQFTSWKSLGYSNISGTHSRNLLPQ